MTTMPTDADEVAAHLAEMATNVPDFTHLQFEQLSAAERIDAQAAAEQLSRCVEAIRVRALAALDHATQEETGPETDMTESEVMAAIRWPISTVKTRPAEAGELARHLPETLAALQAAQVSWQQAKALTNLTNCMSDEHARAAQDKTPPRMPNQGYTTTRRAINKTTLTADPDGAAKRHTEQKDKRHVTLQRKEHGMATLCLYTTAQTARAMLNTIDATCRKKPKTDTRTFDQHRADTFAAMALTGKLGWPQGTDTPATAHVLVALETLLGLSDTPGKIEGYGPVSAIQAHALATGTHSIWRRLITDTRGRPAYPDPHTHRPTATERRHVMHRDRECDVPGRHKPARLYDPDHETPFAKGGRTHRKNLRPRCHRHHPLKTRGQWDTDHDGPTAHWTSTTTGRTHTSTPKPYPVTTHEDLLNPPQH